MCRGSRARLPPGARHSDSQSSDHSAGSAATMESIMDSHDVELCAGFHSEGALEPEPEASESGRSVLAPMESSAARAKAYAKQQLGIWLV
eukprot:588472-Pleurochrysis_carterae.AAC.3